MTSIRKQIHSNAVALISLFVAVSSLAYNSWRNETTEDQRNVRYASFRVLENLADLQQVVDFRYYYLPFDEQGKQEGELRIRGFGNAAMIRDLMMLMSTPVPAAGENLNKLWQEHFSRLDDLDTTGKHSVAAVKAEQELTGAIRRARKSVLKTLGNLQ